MKERKKALKRVGTQIFSIKFTQLSILKYYSHYSSLTVVLIENKLFLYIE